MSGQARAIDPRYRCEYCGCMLAQCECDDLDLLLSEDDAPEDEDNE